MVMQPFLNFGTPLFWEWMKLGISLENRLTIASPS